MLKQLMALVLLLILNSSVMACDACSCTSMNSLDGQLVPSNKSLFGFSSSYVHQLDANQQKINYMSYSLFGAFTFARKWQVMANVPLQQNVIAVKGEKNSHQIGLGDASLMLSYRLWSTPLTSMAKSKHSTILRGGVKLPTGYYDVNNLVTSNLGTKSVDFLLGAQYIFERNSQGLNAAVNFRFNTKNKFDYQYGNKYDISAFYFVKRDFKKHAYMPFVGLTGEYIHQDQANGFERTLSGGEAIYGTGGLLWNWNERVSIFAKAELPIVQNFKSPDGQIYNNIRAQIQVSYYLKDKQKISKKVKIK